MKLSIVIVNRNRSFEIIKNTLDAIVPQLYDDVLLTLVDYGSEVAYQQRLKALVKQDYPQVYLILCPTQGQLWNKSRCINIVLKTCATGHFMVCDMDMIWHPAFLKKTMDALSVDESVYYTVGIMTQEESAIDKTFEEYEVKFQTGHEATGITIFPTEHLKSINGFDEFYHGWGSEDTDVHMRLRNAGYKVRFREEEIYFKHQWHEKTYRSKKSKLPFHAKLEPINHSYFSLSRKLKKVKANTSHEWGKPFQVTSYLKLETPQHFLNIMATEDFLKGLINIIKESNLNNVVQINITTSIAERSLRTWIKRLMKKKTPLFVSLDKVNDTLLEFVIMNYRNNAYHYKYDLLDNSISLVLNLNKS